MTESTDRQPIGKVIRNFFMFGIAAGFPLFLFGIVLAFVTPFFLLGPDSAFGISMIFSLPFGCVCGSGAGLSAGFIAGIVTFTAKHDEKIKFGWIIPVWLLLTIWLTISLGAVVIFIFSYWYS